MIVLAFIAVAAIGASCVRAVRRSITHDEAHTYLTFVLGGLDTFFFHYIPNNHPVNTVLCRISTALFGAAPPVLRLGALLAFAGAIAILSKMIARSRATAIVAFSAAASLFFLPTFFDFASLARGYVIGTFFLIAAAERIVATTDPDRPPRRYDRMLIAFLRSLAVLCVPTFLAGAVAQEIAFLLHRRKFERVPFAKLLSQAGRDAAIVLLLPAAVLFLPLLSLEAPPSSVAGKTSFGDFLKSFGPHTYFPPNESSPEGVDFVAWRCLFPPAFFFAAIGTATACALGGFLFSKRGSRRTYAERWAIVAAISSLSTAALHVAAVKLLGIHWPMPRVLIDFFVMGWSVVVAVTIAANGFRRPGRLLSACLTVVMAIAVTVFLSGITFDATIDWPGDESSHRIHREISMMFRDRGDRPAEIWCEPTLERSIEFYRVTEKTSWIAPIDTSWGEQPKKPYDAYILHDGYLLIPEVVRHLRIVKRFDETGRFIAVIK